ncbi:MAG TPA: sugar-binding protein, partial [Verrucomicrobiae bacterium]|nr:sugar-binding protein [Verrucomicrobiae bacterium]
MLYNQVTIRDKESLALTQAALMRPKFLIPLIVGLLFSLSPLAHAGNDIEPGKEYYTVIRTPAPIVLDGNLSEWAGVPVLSDPKFSVPKGSGPTGTGKYVLFEEYAGGTWTGPDDQTSAVQVVYDADNVYFGFVVTDDYHENAANSAWNGDSIQLMIASADRTQQIALYNYALGGVEGATGDTIVEHEAGPGGTSAVVTRNAATKRTTYEIKLPKESLGLTNLAAGVQFGLGMAINDGDQATPGQRGWGGLGAHALVFGKSPGETALMTLAAPPIPPSNDIEPGKERYTVVKVPAPISLDGNLSEWSGVPVLADPKFSIPKGSGPKGTGKYVLFEEYAGGTWTGPDDQTSAVQVAYDADNVYFGFVVTDDYHENAANSAWNGDSIQLMIASADRTQQIALYNYALGGTEEALGDTIVEHEAGPGGTSAVVTRNTTTKRTTYEIKLPKESLGLTNLTGGVQFGLGMAINDGDKATPGQRGWGGLGAHALVFGKSPGETALMTLETYNDIEPGKEKYTATLASHGVAVDGSLSEWAGVPVLADPKFSVPKGTGPTGTGKYVLFEEYAGGTWTGPDDQTSAVQIVYDTENVYVGVVVTDDYHENSANSAWNGDSIQLMIASADRTQQVALYNYALGGVETNLGTTIVMHEAGPGGTTAAVVRDTLNKKTIYEIQLPASSLGLTVPLLPGTQFGLGMAINDGDQATPGQRGWGGLGAHALVFGKSPGETALVTLGTTGSGSALFFLSAVNPGITTFSFRASDLGASIVNPASAKLLIDGQVVPLVVSPKVLDATDFTYVGTVPFAAGNHTYSIEVRDTSNQAVTDSGTFISARIPVLTAANKAVSVDTNAGGFQWNFYQNEAAHLTPTNATGRLDEAELALAGLLTDDTGTLLPNIANPDALGVSPTSGKVEGPVVRFTIPTVINLNRAADGVGGSPDFNPADQMPGL